MKFFFSKTDSLYKIFKALEKIPSHREVEIFIDPEHALFDNERRGLQIKDILEKSHIEATFMTKNKKNRDYFSKIWLKVDYEQKKNIENFLHIFYLFFFNIKKFHLHTYESKKYLFILIFLFEILLILGILRFIISLIIPSANITIFPSENTETIVYNVRYYSHDDPYLAAETRFLYVPYYTWSIDYKYDLTISSSNIKHITSPSHWEIKVFNKKEREYSIVKGTQFITSDGLIFRADDDFIIPAGDEKRPSEIIISVTADEYDEYGQLMGVHGNILFNTKLLIKNLEESSLTQDIRAESIESFAWWQTESIWSINDKDIEQLREKLTMQVYDQKMDIVKQNFSISWWFLLPFETITTTTFNNIEIPELSWDNSTTVRWTAYVTYNYLYVMREDLYQIFMTYVNERPSENNLVMEINKNTMQFLKDSNTTNSDEIKKSGKVYTIATQVDVVQTYDFENDPKQILMEIKNKIPWMNINDARNFLLSSYNEIGSVKISLPLRYDSIPIIKSRIKINYK